MWHHTEQTVINKHPELANFLLNLQSLPVLASGFFLCSSKAFSSDNRGLGEFWTEQGGQEAAL